MDYKHTFKASLTWRKTDKEINSSKKVYEKSHTISIAGKPQLSISAAKAFKGDPALYNPEDLLLSSLMSCHMMSYLYVCATHNIELVSYADNAVATLETNADGSGKIIEVQLNPQVTLKDKNQQELALSLHQEANKLCFIANSCNFPVKHHATCVPAEI